MTCKRRLQQGTSLLEVLFAVFLVAVCATILAASMPTATRSQKIADLNNKATNLAQKELEAIRALGYANVTPTQLASAQLIDSTTPVQTNTYAFTNVDAGVTDSVAQVLPSGTGTVLIEQMDLDLRRVTVTVTYQMRGVAKTVRMGTLVANL
ncbi:MAG: hypothetical protein M9921_03465 [Fimbriimonadaceae bacterium]|nr:hypothetical protein [Chthonomonadaceae bacterium]MCO5295894.1 hypothetical protein [Fimbriimonadaceae bacterium]